MKIVFSDLIIGVMIVFCYLILASEFYLLCKLIGIDLF